jgi:1,4-dihydroxy-6-naphthoate synthase
MEIEIGFSPCPNDTFIFDAMVHGRINTEGLSFKVTMADVEELNRLAFANALHVTKLSFHAYAHVFQRYILLNSGSALGSNCGPLLIAKKDFAMNEVDGLRIAIPGKFTTANFLMSFAFPMADNRVEMLFSDIEGAVARDEVDAGVIIHENRFTYAERGFVKLMDLGVEHVVRETFHSSLVLTRRTLEGLGLDPETAAARVDRAGDRHVPSSRRGSGPKTS